MNDESFGVVVDTNLWVSMAMGSRVVSEQMFKVIENPTINIYTSVELLEELTTTLAKPRLQKHLSHERTKFLFEIIWLQTQLKQVTISLTICRDPKDNFIINLATETNAKYILTGDNDLLVLNPIGNIEVMTISDFLKISNSAVDGLQPPAAE